MKEIVKFFWYVFCRLILTSLDDSIRTTLMWRINSRRLGYKYYNHDYGTLTHYIAQKKNNIKEDYCIYVDKIIVKNRVNFCENMLLIPTIAQKRLFTLKELRRFQRPYILKANHGSGMNLFIRNNHDIRWQVLLIQLRWYLTNTYFLSREPQYRRIKRKVLIEPVIGNNISDYKFFCYKGRVRFVQVDSDRYIRHKRNMYTRDMRLISVRYCYENGEIQLPSKSAWYSMCKVAEELSEKFEFVRIDLYLIDSNIYYGEHTFCPEGGYGVFDTLENDKLMYKLLLSNVE